MQVVSRIERFQPMNMLHRRSLGDVAPQAPWNASLGKFFEGDYPRRQVHVRDHRFGVVLAEGRYALEHDCLLGAEVLRRTTDQMRHRGAIAGDPLVSLVFGDSQALSLAPSGLGREAVLVNS